MTPIRLLRRLLLSALVLGLGWMLLWLFPWSHPEGKTRVRVLSWNVHGFHHPDGSSSLDVVLDGLASQDADILVFQEFPVARVGARARQALHEAGYPHEALFAYDHSVTNSYAMGLAIYSRRPLLRWREVPLQPLAEGRLLALADVDVDGRPLRVGGLHMPNSDIHVNGKRAMVTQELWGENLRTIQVESMLEACAPWRGEAFVLAGDFNTFPLSAAWRKVRGEYLDAFPPNLWWAGTFRIGEKLDVKIDHIFHSKKVRSLSANVPPLTGSDHLPVVADLQF